MTPTGRPLRGLRVGLSVSGVAEDLTLRGFTEEGVNRLTVRLARVLLAEGATLAFGHDWRAGGVMEAIANIAMDYQPALEHGETGPPILNLLPWDESSSVTDATLLSRLKGVVQVVPAGLPPELRPLEAEAQRAGRKSEAWRYLRARGLTHLRRQLAECCQARIALGGKLTGYDGRLPGIVEEVFLSCASRQPVYLAGLLGGASEALGRLLIGDAVAGAARPALADSTPPPLGEAYTRFASPIIGCIADTDLNAEAVLAALADRGRECLRSNGLTDEENRSLLATHLEEEAVSLILRGLKKVWDVETRSLRGRPET